MTTHAVSMECPSPEDPEGGRVAPASVTRSGRPSGRTGGPVSTLCMVTDNIPSPSSHIPCNSSDVYQLYHLYLYLSKLQINPFTFLECELADFVTGSSTENIPFVFLPLTGQLVYPR